MYCCCLLWVLVCSSGASPVNIGIIDDFDSRSGKEEQIAMEIAVSDFYGPSNLQLALYFNNSGTSPVQAYSLVFWPGGASSVPRGYTIPTDANPLVIGVPLHPAFDDFVKVDCNDSSCSNPKVTGFSFDVFIATLANLPYNLSYKFKGFSGSYDAMIQQLQSQTFQAVIGDTSILAKRCEYAQFTPPYSEPGLQAVIYLKHHPTNKAWLFKTPFTHTMWIVTGLVNLYNGFVVWLIERRRNTALRGSIWNQIGTLITLAFTTLFSLHGGKLHSNMSRMTMLVWLFVALVVTQSYTASLTSSLTVQKLTTQTLDIQELIRDKVKVGCDGNSFVGSYLEGMRFSTENIIKVYNADEYPQLLKNGTIKAAFLITPYVKIFLAKYCRGYATAEPTFHVGGFGFGFAKGHPLLPDMSQAILNVSESGEISRLERKMLSKYNCSESQQKDDSELGSLDINSFAGLFGITFATSTVALLAFCVSHLRQNRQWDYCRVAAEPQAAAGNHEPERDETHMFAYEMETYDRWRQSVV
uniref:Ionotropic glutamate receptor C-terminal domain-containing protein n=1 Tax=Kalanchoe fedtschenkoi TaxID=63787 RepID=A0A7N0U3S1_KALFE